MDTPQVNLVNIWVMNSSPVFFSLVCFVQWSAVFVWIFCNNSKSEGPFQKYFNICQVPYHGHWIYKDEWAVGSGPICVSILWLLLHFLRKLECQKLSWVEFWDQDFMLRSQPFWNGISPFFCDNILKIVGSVVMWLSVIFPSSLDSVSASLFRGKPACPGVQYKQIATSAHLYMFVQICPSTALLLAWAAHGCFWWFLGYWWVYPIPLVFLVLFLISWWTLTLSKLWLTVPSHCW